MKTLKLKTRADAYMALDEDYPAIDCDQNLGTSLIPTQLTHGELPAQIENLESFVCHIFCKSGSHNLSELRWEMFRSRKLEVESLPPTRATILPHIICANYIALRDKLFTSNCQVLPPIDKNGWPHTGNCIPASKMSGRSHPKSCH